MMPLRDLFVHTYVLVDDALAGGAVSIRFSWRGLRWRTLEVPVVGHAVRPVPG